MMLPPPSLRHHGYRVAAHEEGTGDVHRKAFLPHILRNLRKRRAGRKPGGIVDQHVDAAEFGLHGGDGPPGSLRVRYVALPADGGAARGDNHARRTLRRLRIYVARLDPGPFPGKGERDGAADTAARAANQRALAVEACRFPHSAPLGLNGTFLVCCLTSTLHLSAAPLVS